jgi:uncharacterized protein
MSSNNYKTPGIYIQEVSSFPPSVVEVSTAVPAFIGYTEKGSAAPESPLVIRRISSMTEYELYFGKAFPVDFEVKVHVPDKNANASSDSKITDKQIEVKLQNATHTPDYLMWYNLDIYFKNGGGPCYIVSVGVYDTEKNSDDFLDGLDALKMESEPTLLVLSDAASLGDYGMIVSMALKHCAELQNRFTIVDVPDANGNPPFQDFRTAIGTQYLAYGAAYYPSIQTTLPLAFDENKEGTVNHMVLNQKFSISGLKSKDNAAYYQVVSALSRFKAVLPPSAAIAGIYTRTDNDRGVWKAPANVSLTGVLAPTVKISHESQAGMNIDPNSGKSINAIRAFPGKGVLVWGARTLAGNDNDWRYVPVRRLFIMVEQSLKKATQFAVFEPNSAGTWLKVKSMIDSFLFNLWKQGGMAGEKQDQAYFINVGLGVTMTPQDILEGKMIVEVGIAPVRPAEFILLKFTQILQQA